jgi:multimeric flavodoxin WrbA
LKVTAFVGSARKKHTHNAVRKLLDGLKAQGNVETEIVMLSDYDLRACRGCQLCTSKGEEFCQLKDDRDKLIAKMMDSDGIIFAAPTYTFQVSALMKLFLDRLAFLLHRPRLHGKAFAGIAVQATYGGRDVLKYLSFVGGALGCNVIKGYCLTSLEPMSDKGRAKTERAIDDLSQRFYAKLIRKEFPAPDLLRLFIFRMARTSVRLMLTEDFRDYSYYKDKGWFESDYYYPIKLGPFKKLTGKLFDLIAARVVKNY